jgi:hypothetical protein
VIELKVGSIGQRFVVDAWTISLIRTMPLKIRYHLKDLKVDGRILLK